MFISKHSDKRMNHVLEFIMQKIKPHSLSGSDL